MNAAIIAVGSELLTPSRMDTNSLFLTERLNGLGVEVGHKMVVGDSKANLEAAIQYCLDRCELLILTGGLGPTEDDLTREAVAAATGRALVFDKEICGALEARFQNLGRTMAEINKRQCYVLEGSEVLANARGTAPGQWLRLPSRQVVVLLPGPPGEMKPMVEAEFLPRLRKMLPPLALATLTYRVAGMGESDLDALISPVYKQYQNPVTTILAKAGDITIHLRAQTTEQAEAERLVAELGARIRPLLGDKIYSDDGTGLEHAVIRMLAERGQSVAVAESLTAGLLGARLAVVPGASKAFVGGFVTYTNGMKEGLLGVSAKMLAEHGAVSEAVAVAMAAGARERTRAQWALSLTGVAGPDGGTAETPVGTVFLGMSGVGVGDVAVKFRFPGGDRERVRQFAVQAALNALRLKLMKG
jgi:nicotinamide-nucleotide amidase